MKKNIANEIAARLIASNPRTKTELNAFKRQICAEFKIPYPGNIYLLSVLKASKYAAFGRLADLLRVRPVRSLSGIVNVSVLTKAYPCPGNCLYCPNEPGFPKSYLSGEPAAERAKLLKFNPYVQVKKRLENLAAEGHSVDKIELRVIGGTWSFYPKAYQTKFIAQCFKACNDYCVGPTHAKSKIRRSRKPADLDLEKEQKKNENTKCRIVGISVETRPDHINEKEVGRLRKLGVTRVELGIQSIFDDVLALNNRGHKINAAVQATKLLKDAGFKISYQIMLNLHGSNPRRDLEMARILFANPDFCPDLLKIYPCAVLREAPLFKLYQQGKYHPYPDEQLVSTVKEIKKIIPPWTRVERIIRDIPSPRITAGTKTVSNLRQIIANDMKREGWSCQCIRCREVKGEYDAKEKTVLVRRDYQASGGTEIFLSFENESKTKLFSLLRLRITNNSTELITGNTGGYTPLPTTARQSKARPYEIKYDVNTEIRANDHSPLRNAVAIIREIHTYGIQTAIGNKSISAQHTGLGRKLIADAEKIAKTEFGVKKIAAISGVGARAYWRKNDYKLKNGYMVKFLNQKIKKRLNRMLQ